MESKTKRAGQSLSALLEFAKSLNAFEKPHNNTLRAVEVSEVRAGMESSTSFITVAFAWFSKNAGPKRRPREIPAQVQLFQR